MGYKQMNIHNWKHFTLYSQKNGQQMRFCCNFDLFPSFYVIPAAKKEKGEWMEHGSSANSPPAALGDAVLKSNERAV